MPCGLLWVWVVLDIVVRGVVQCPGQLYSFLFQCLGYTVTSSSPPLPSPLLPFPPLPFFPFFFTLRGEIRLK